LQNGNRIKKPGRVWQKGFIGSLENICKIKFAEGSGKRAEGIQGREGYVGKREKG